MLPRLVIRLLIIFLILFVLAGWQASGARPQDALYAYRTEVYEHVLMRLQPSGPARDNYALKLFQSRLEEATVILKDHELEKSQTLYRVFVRAAEGCVSHSQKLVEERKWQRAQHLAARCLGLASAHLDLWSWIEGLETDKHPAMGFVQALESVMPQLVGMRASALEIAARARDSTDFLSGLDEHLETCFAAMDKTLDNLEASRSRVDSSTARVLDREEYLLKELASAVKKSQNTGNHIEAWLFGSEICGRAVAVSARAKAASKWQISLMQTVEIPGFREIE